MSEFRVRASSWGKLFDCAYKFEGENLMGMSKASGIRAALGTSLHASTAAFDSGRIIKSGVTMDDTAGVLLDTLKNPGYDVEPDIGLSPREAQRIGLSLHAKYCLEVSPKYEYSSVEMATKPLDIDCGGGTVITLTGTLDRSRVIAGTNGVRIADLKSGVRAVQKGVATTRGHAPQVGTYELLFEHTTGIKTEGAAEIIGMKTSGKTEIATATIEGAKKLMVGDGQTPGLIEIAANMFRTGLFPPNPQSYLCSQRFCARWSKCAYRAR